MRNRGSGLTQLFRWGFPALLAGLLPLSARPCAAAETPHILAIKAGRILTVTKGTIENGVILIQNGKIVALGRQGEVTIPAGAEVIDASSEWVMPGQVDLHVHIGNDSGLHDYVHTLNPEFRVWDFINPDDPLVRDDIASGVTTALTIPGSGGNNSGFGVLWKLGGAKREDLILRKLGSMKVAQAYNPERRAGDLGLSRMGMWWMLREMFARAGKYEDGMKAYEEWEQKNGQPTSGVSLVSADAAASRAAKAVDPPKDILGLDNLRAVLEKKTPVIVHTAGARDVMETMRMFHDEMDLKLVITHGEFGGFRAAQEAAKRSIPCNIGPRLYDFSYQTYDRKFYSLPAEYEKAGVQNISLCTDCPVIPADDLFLQGTVSIHMGMDEDLALRALTINPAIAIGIGDRIGSLEVGKDADLVIKKGSLFDVRNPIDKVFINGNLVYRHGQRRRGTGAGPFAQRNSVAEDDGDEEDGQVESGAMHKGFLSISR